MIHKFKSKLLTYVSNSVAGKAQKLNLKIPSYSESWHKSHRVKNCGSLILQTLVPEGKS